LLNRQNGWTKNKSKKRKMTTSPTPHQQQREISEPPRQKDTSPPTDNGGWYKSRGKGGSPGRRVASATVTIVTFRDCTVRIVSLVYALVSDKTWI
jgi:hypothetical protein